jgi:2-methylcitrate dehydratase PrpD
MRIDAIELRVNPLVRSVTGVEAPDTGLRSKFSIYHSAAVAWIDGAARIPQYTDERASDSAVVALGHRVKVTSDESLRSDQAEAVVIVDGVRHRTFVEHASGTADNPMSDLEIEAKFLANAEPVIGHDRARRVRDLINGLDGLPDVRQLIRLCE